ncbi:MAG: BlaI/MecI/CopY family transcriptional regulator, partial [Fimbriimonas sp.]|nr:BlaI/MecI/CopY family transcriptional regulator [Fimbriimonas sp.]
KNKNDRGRPAGVGGGGRAPPPPPTVRKLLRILEEKGQIEHVETRGGFLYRPKMNKESAAKGALNKLVQTFFAGSLRDTVATLIDSEDRNLTDEELDDLRKLIDRARKRR